MAGDSTDNASSMLNLLPPHVLRNSLEHLSRPMSPRHPHQDHPRLTATLEAKGPTPRCPMPGRLQRESLHSKPQRAIPLTLPQIVTAVLNRYYNWAHPNSVEYVKWYIGEVGTAVYVVNVPACWPLLRKLFPWATRTSTLQSPSATGNSSYALRSGAEKRSKTKSAIHNSRTGWSESEENLALDMATFGKSSNAWPGNMHNASADARSGELHDEGNMQGPGIVKTVEVLQHESFSRNRI